MSALMSLPLEVRRMIWEHTLSGKSTDVVCHTSIGLCNHIDWSAYIKPRKQLRLVNKQVKDEVHSVPITIGFRRTHFGRFEVFLMKNPEKPVYVQQFEVNPNPNPDEYRHDLGSSWSPEVHNAGLGFYLRQRRKRMEGALARYGRVTIVHPKRKNVTRRIEGNVQEQGLGKHVIKFEAARSSC